MRCPGMRYTAALTLLPCHAVVPPFKKGQAHPTPPPHYQSHTLLLYPCRGPPLLPFDYPNWSDYQVRGQRSPCMGGSRGEAHFPFWLLACPAVQGIPCSLERPPSIDGENGWFVVRLPTTDVDGWLYGTTFGRLDVARPGGRASRRASDQIRSRVWRRLVYERVRA